MKLKLLGKAKDDEHDNDAIVNVQMDMNHWQPERSKSQGSKQSVTELEGCDNWDWGSVCVDVCGKKETGGRTDR